MSAAGPGEPIPPAGLEQALRLHKAGHAAQALLAYRLVLSRNPGLGLAQVCCASLLLELGDLARAQEACTAALASPLSGSERAGLAQVLAGLAKALGPGPGLPWLERAVALQPSDDALLVQLMAAHAQGLMLEAAHEDLRALDLRCPVEHRYRWNRAILQLVSGDWAEGLRGYEVRWELPPLREAAARLPSPRWQGEPLEGRTLLLCAEQGLGDTLNFLRYGVLAKDRGARVVAQVQACLLEVVRTAPGLDEVQAWQDDRHPPHDCHLSLVSAPFAFGTTPGSVPGPPVYLSVPAEVPNRADLAARIERQPGLRVGLVWAGGRGHDRDAERSLDPALLEPLLSLQGLSWFSLQKGREPLIHARLIDLDLLLSSFADTAFALSCLDLLVSVDTSVAHLAGAMGVPTLLLLTHFPDWRWLLDRTDTPWYPKTRLFRQPAPGDWAGAVGQVAGFLART